MKDTVHWQESRNTVCVHTAQMMGEALYVAVFSLWEDGASSDGLFRHFEKSPYGWIAQT